MCAYKIRKGCWNCLPNCTYLKPVNYWASLHDIGMIPKKLVFFLKPCQGSGSKFNVELYCREKDWELVVIPADLWSSRLFRMLLLSLFSLSWCAEKFQYFWYCFVYTVMVVWYAVVTCRPTTTNQLMLICQQLTIWMEFQHSKAKMSKQQDYSNYGCQTARLLWMLDVTQNCGHPTIPTW